MGNILRKYPEKFRIAMITDEFKVCSFPHDKNSCITFQLSTVIKVEAPGDWLLACGIHRGLNGGKLYGIIYEAE